MKLKAELCFALSRLEIEDYYDEKQFHSDRPKMYQYSCALIRHSTANANQKVVGLGEIHKMQKNTKSVKLG